MPAWLGRLLVTAMSAARLRGKFAGILVDEESVLGVPSPKTVFSAVTTSGASFQALFSSARIVLASRLFLRAPFFIDSLIAASAADWAADRSVVASLAMNAPSSTRP